MAIKKNDIVTNNIQIVIGSPSNLIVIPVGTQLRVWKATRRGILYCTAIDRSLSYYTINAYATDVTKVEQSKPNVNVGDIFVCSWGYDQTNIDYYKVMEVKNKSVVIAPIGQDRTYTGHMQGECSPVPNVVSDKRITKRIISCGNSVSLKMTSYSWAYPWSGKTNHFTEWA
jgi:hypothetical protein